jgi:deoxyribonuclease-4
VLLGGHVSSAGGIHTAIDRIEAIGGNAVQLFTQSPRTWRPTAHAPESLARFRERRDEAGVGYVLCHALYLINLASSDRELYRKSVTALLATLDVAREIEGDVVFHVGSHLGGGLEPCLPRVVDALREALAHTSDTTWLLLENSAGAGGTIGRSVADLALIGERLGFPKQLGVCLDTCHLWVSGVDVTDATAVGAILEEVDGSFGLPCLRAIHLNDAAAPLGSNRDRHANIGEGLIADGLGVVLRHPRLRELPFLLETPGPDGRGPDENELRKARALAEGRAAATGASRRGSRSKRA